MEAASMIRPNEEADIKIGEMKDQPTVSAANPGTKKTLLYFCVLAVKGEEEVCQNWYVLDPMDPPNEAKTKWLSPAFQLPRGYPRGFASAAVGSKIYVFGGFEPGKMAFPDVLLPGPPPGMPSYCEIQCGKPYSTAMVYDTADDTSNPSWLTLCDMLSPKSFPKATVLDGKVYVMGSMTTRSAKLKPWIEAYDPSTDLWSQVPKPTYCGVGRASTLYASMCTADEAQRRILVGTQPLRPRSFSLDVQTQQWTCHGLPIFLSNSKRGKHAIADGVLYMIFVGKLFAYDFKTPVALVPGLEKVADRKTTDVYLFHLGNKNFCALWSPPYSGRSSSALVIVCSKFRVDTSYDPQGNCSPRAFSQGRTLYSLAGSYLYDCITMDVLCRTNPLEDLATEKSEDSGEMVGARKRAFELISDCL